MIKKTRKLNKKNALKLFLPILVLVMALSAGFYFKGDNIVNKLFADKKDSKIENYEVNNADIYMNGLQIGFYDNSGSGASPVDYGKLKSDGSSDQDVYLKITNTFSEKATVTLGSVVSDGLNVSYGSNAPINLNEAGTGGSSTFVEINYSASGSVSDGDVYYMEIPVTYEFDNMYDGDSTSSKKQFTKTVPFAVSYKATTSSSYANITMLNWAKNDGASDINFTMTPSFISANDNFYAQTSFDQGSCNVAKSTTPWIGLNTPPGKCNASYTVNMYVNREVYTDFSNVGFSFGITNLSTDTDEKLKFDGTPSMSWNDNDGVPTIVSDLTNGIVAGGGTGTLAFTGDIPGHNSTVKTLSIPINFVEEVSVYIDTTAALTMTVNLHAYTTTVYNNLLGFVTSCEQSGVIDEFANDSVSGSYYGALRNARKALANPRRTDYEMNAAYSALEDAYNDLISSSDKYSDYKYMLVRDLLFSGDMSAQPDSTKSHYRVYHTDGGYVIPQDSDYLNAVTTNKHTVQYTGTATDNMIFNNKYWHIDTPADLTDYTAAISAGDDKLNEDPRKYTTESRDALETAVNKAKSYVDPNTIDQPELQSDFSDVVSEINTALGNLQIATYTIQYVDDDNETVIQTDTKEYGTAMPDAPADPTKASTAQYTYAFAGWTDNATVVSSTVVENVTYTATYTPTIRSYTVEFDDADGTELQTDTIEYGQLPEYTGATPTKAATAQYTYTFSGWDPEITTVTGNITYKATYNEELNYYTITFKDYNGDTIKQNSVGYGEMPTPPNSPTRASTTSTVYTFAGWDEEVTSVTGDKTYTATYDESPRPYLITFKNEDGTTLQSSEVPYGTVPTYDGETPTKEATAQYTYTFDGWDNEPVAVTGEATYTAIYASTVNKYLIVFEDEDGTELQASEVEYGQTPTPPADPTKAATAEYTYTFSGWSPEVVPVTTKVSYRATYSQTKNTYKIRFLDEEGKELQSSYFEYGETPVYNGATPTKEGNAEYSYVFDGWDKDLLDVVGDEDYTVKFAPVKNKYTIVFENEDGTELQSSEVEYGETPAYSGETPTKEATAQYTYTFDAWSPAITSVTGAATYTATYTQTVREYTITFEDEDGTELQSSSVAYGQTPVYSGETPTKEATAQYTYTFDAWSPAITSVTEAATYTATYTQTVREYTITFEDEDGTELQSSSVAYGQTPTYSGETPTKEATAQYTYTFNGWSPEVVAVTGEATYTATYTSTVNEYTITFVNYDGTELQSSSVAYGETPVYSGATPTKEGNAEYSYVFDKWDKELLPVVGEETYTAQFTPVKNKYTITFEDEDGTELQSSEVEYGVVPTAPANPSKAATAEYTYTFNGWSPEVVAVTGEATYQATYSYVKNKYTITFKNDDGSTINSSEVEYGVVPTAPSNPTKAATAEYTYTFNAWSPEVVAVTGEATYTATYTSTVNEYEIKFVDDDNSELKTINVPYGTVPSYGDSNPTKAATAEYTYTFDGWDPELTAVTGTATYKAKYTSVKNKYTITFIDDDNTVISTAEVEYGVVPTAPADPSKAATAEYTYTFNGWDNEVVAVTGEATYQATYTSVKNKYTITFEDEDHTAISSAEVEYGQMPTAPADPSKAATAEYTYTFNGWSPEVSTVTGAQTYTATYTTVKNKYTVTFVDEDDQVLQTGEVEYGVTPTYTGVTPTKAQDAQYTYTFDGWTPSVGPVTEEVTYRVLFRADTRSYKITFKNYDGTVLQESDVLYGTTPSYTGETPTKPADVGHVYAFAGWNPEVASVSGVAEYSATFTSSTRTYEVSFETNGGSAITSYNIDSGSTITKPTDPTKEGFILVDWYSDSELTTKYDFSTPVTSDVKLYAKWEEEVFEYLIVDGANQEYTLDEAGDLTITSNGNYVKFIGIKVDNEEVSASNYTAKSGSTIVTLKAAYLETLSEGEHTITFMYRDGEVSTKFVANKVEEKSDSNNPPTGDKIIRYIIMLIASVVGLISIIFIRRRKTANRG